MLRSDPLIHMALEAIRRLEAESTAANVHDNANARQRLWGFIERVSECEGEGCALCRDQRRCEAQLRETLFFIRPQVPEGLGCIAFDDTSILLTDRDNSAVYPRIS